MIRVILADPTVFSDREIDNVYSDPSFTSFLKKGKNEKVNKERAAAYLTVKEAYLLIFKAPFPTLFKDDHGRPYLSQDENTHINISISHTDGVVVCCIADDGERVGIDIEFERKIENEKKLIDRYLINVKQTLHKQLPRVEFYFLTPNNTELSSCHFSLLPLEKIDFCDEENDNFFVLWTKLEALVKADGRGFLAVSDKSIFESFRSSSFLFNFKGLKYYISLASI
jgi:hypothetical protein